MGAFPQSLNRLYTAAIRKATSTMVLSEFGGFPPMKDSPDYMGTGGLRPQPRFAPVAKDAAPPLEEVGDADENAAGDRGPHRVAQVQRPVGRWIKRWIVDRSCRQLEAERADGAVDAPGADRGLGVVPLLVLVDAGKAGAWPHARGWQMNRDRGPGGCSLGLRRESERLRRLAHVPEDHLLARLVLPGLVLEQQVASAGRPLDREARRLRHDAVDDGLEGLIVGHHRQRKEQHGDHWRKYQSEPVHEAITSIQPSAGAVPGRPRLDLAGRLGVMSY